MAKKKKAGPVADDSTGKIKVKEKQEVQPTGNETEGNVTKVKEKMKLKPTIVDDEIIKVDLNKPPKIEENADQEQETSNVATDKSTEIIQEVVEEISPEQNAVQNEDTPTLEEVTEEQKQEVGAIAEEASEAIKESIDTGKPLPENIEKLVNFMEETGGDINDYVKLNKDYSGMDNQDLLHEYYKQTKPHLNAEEISFLMDDQFSYEEDVDDEKEIKRKKLALKEQVADARAHLDGQKSKYYEEIKSGSKLTDEQKKAIDFFNRHSKEAEEAKRYENKAKSNFLNRTNKFFGDKFKGFEYNVGDKKFRFNVKDADKVKETQSDINNFIGKFLDEDRQMADEAGYHKSLFTAMNPDAIANHFYEQGKADALKQSITESKNVNMKPRQELNENLNHGGIKARVLGDSTADFKFKIKNK
jgi:hypothetical protein